jgi:hypothetical protein
MRLSSCIHTPTFSLSSVYRLSIRAFDPSRRDLLVLTFLSLSNVIYFWELSASLIYVIVSVFLAASHL